MLTLQGKIEMAKRTLELRKLQKNKMTVVPEALTFHDADEAEDLAMESCEDESDEE